MGADAGVGVVAGEGPGAREVRVGAADPVGPPDARVGDVVGDPAEAGATLVIVTRAGVVVAGSGVAAKAGADESVELLGGAGAVTARVAPSVELGTGVAVSTPHPASATAVASNPAYRRRWRVGTRQR